MGNTVSAICFRTRKFRGFTTNKAIEDFIGQNILLTQYSGGIYTLIKATITTAATTNTGGSNFSFLINSISHPKFLSFADTSFSNVRAISDNGSIYSFALKNSLILGADILILSSDTALTLSVNNAEILSTSGSPGAGADGLVDVYDGIVHFTDLYDPSPVGSAPDYPTPEQDFTNTRLVGNMFYVSNAPQALKSRNSNCYIEQWEIDSSGNINRLDTILEVPAYKIHSRGQVVSSSYYP